MQKVAEECRERKKKSTKIQKVCGKRKLKYHTNYKVKKGGDIVKGEGNKEGKIKKVREEFRRFK